FAKRVFHRLLIGAEHVVHRHVENPSAPTRRLIAAFRACLRERHSATDDTLGKRDAMLVHDRGEPLADFVARSSTATRLPACVARVRTSWTTSAGDGRYHLTRRLF